MHVLTFDIEEWYHFDTFSTEDMWLNYPPRIDLYLPKVLDMLDAEEIKSTFFCLGWIARTYPNVLKEIQARGHEIACHTDKHLFVREMTPEAFDADLTLALESIEQVTGAKVRTFRAPAFSISEDSKWAFEVLAAHGIERDCSIFPATRDFGGFPSFNEARPCIIDYNGIKLQEFPINTTRILGKEVVYCGGGYFRLFPYWYIKQLLKRTDYAMTYLHMRDFDYEQPKFSYLSLARKFKSYYGLKRAWGKFEKLIQDFHWVGVQAAVDSIDWNNVKMIKI